MITDEYVDPFLSSTMKTVNNKLSLKISGMHDKVDLDIFPHGDTVDPLHIMMTSLLMSAPKL